MVLYYSTYYLCFRFRYKRYITRVFCNLLGKRFLIRHMAGTSGRAVVNDIPPQYRHSSLYAAARVLKDDPERTTHCEVYVYVLRNAT